MRIQDEGKILYINQFSESSLIIRIFSKNHGYISGLYRKKNIGINIGSHVFFSYSRKSINNLGNIQIDKFTNVSIEILFNFEKIKIFRYILKILEKSLPENEINKNIFESLVQLEIDLNRYSDTQKIFNSQLNFECQFLKLMGFEINLHECPIFGTKEKLKFISPKSGQVISEKAGNKYASKLFLLPNIWKNESIDLKDIKNALKITKFFINKRILKK